MAEKKYDIVIIGAGGTGLAAGMYCGRLGMKTLVLGATSGMELPIGGVITTTHLVENYPGFIRLSGPDLAKKLEEHARDYPIDIHEERALELKKEKNYFAVKTDKQIYHALSVIYATGTKWRKLGVPGEEKFANKGVSYCALCMPPDEDVVTNSEIKAIGEITSMTRVLTMDGTYHFVSGFGTRDYEGRLVQIRPRFFNEPVSLTPEHPVLFVEVKKGWGVHYWRDFGFTQPTWKPASEIREGDCVLYPVLKEVNDQDFIHISEYLSLTSHDGMILPRKQTFTSQPLKDQVPLDGDFLRLAGYFLAEGSASRHSLRFYFGKDEQEYVHDVVNIVKTHFGLDARIDVKGSVAIVEVYSRILSDFFKSLFDKYAYKKSIPHSMMILPQEKQKELVKGFWRGDGCIREKDFCFVTVSKKLAYQLRDILLRLGVIPSLQVRRKSSLNKKTHSIEDREISFTHDKYHLTTGGPYLESTAKILDVDHPKLAQRSGVLQHAWIKDGFAILPVREVKEIDYRGKVVSLTVQENQSYVSKGFIVHNCDGPLFRNKVVAMVGGSDSATKESLLLAEYAKKVYIIARSEALRAEPINLKRAMQNKKIEIITKTNVTEIKGNQFVDSIVLDNPYRGKKELAVNGVFVAIGHIPLSELAKEIGVAVNNKGEVIIDKESRTNIPGFFAAGDVVDSEFKQLITGVGEAVKAAYHAYQHVQGQVIQPVDDLH